METVFIKKGVYLTPFHNLMCKFESNSDVIHLSDWSRLSSEVDLTVCYSAIAIAGFDNYLMLNQMMKAV